MWIVFAVLAPALWSITNLFDKYLLEKHIPNINVYLLLTGILNLLVLLGIPFFGFSFPSLQIIVLGIIAGALFNYQMFPYFKALTIEETSRVVPLYQLSPIFVLIISYFILHERLTFSELLSFPFLVTGAFLISIKKIEGVFTLSKGLWFMIFAAFLYALHVVLSKYLYLHVSYYQGLTWVSIGGFLSVLPLLYGKQTRKDAKIFFTKNSLFIQSLMGINELCNIVAIVVLQMALVTGPSSLVTALGGVQPFYIVFLTFMLSLLFPKIIKEDTKLHIVIHKVVALIIISIGVYFAAM